MAKYIPIIKTGEAEIKALENSSFIKENDNFFPLIELTRGRKKTEKFDDGSVSITYPFIKRLERIKKLFVGKKIFFDLTAISDLLSTEIYNLYNSDNGYANWRNFLLGLNNEKVFKQIIPSIIFNWDDNDEDLIRNVKLEVESLTKTFNSILYRCDLASKICYDELSIIKFALNAKTDLWVLIDANYLQEGLEDSAIAVFKKRIENIKNLLQGYKYHIVISSTSFPNNVTEYGEHDTSTIKLIEKDIYMKLNKIYPDIFYSDHATINPIRNDLIKMARGWVPRIDVPINDAVYYYKVRRPKGMSAYKGSYIVAAGRAIADPRFPHYKSEVWGLSMIRDCAYGIVPSSAPSFWISVRMNIHMFQILKWVQTL